MIILDTNVVSELVKTDMDRAVRAWIDSQDALDLHLCAPVVDELVFGAHRVYLRHPETRLRRSTYSLIESTFSGRILPLDTAMAFASGEFRAKRHRMGRPVTQADAMIAGICLYTGATLATRNVRDFEGAGLTVVNPFATATSGEKQP